MKLANAAHTNMRSIIQKNKTCHGHIANLHHALQSHAYLACEQVVSLQAKDGAFDESGVVASDFVSQLFALLSDPHLDTPKSLVFNPQDPFGKYVPPDCCTAK